MTGFLCSLAIIALLCALNSTSAAGLTSSNIVSFSETYADKVTCVNYGGGDIECDEVNSGTYAVRATISLAGVDISQFDEDTPFELIIGNVDLYNVLSDYPKYSAGRTTATFTYTTSYTDQNDNDHTMRWGTVRLTWNATKLTVYASFKNNSNWDDVQYVMADEYDWEDSGPITDTTYAEVDLGDSLSVSFEDVNVTGTIRTRDITKSGDDYTLSSIRIQGVATQ